MVELLEAEISFHELANYFEQKRSVYATCCLICWVKEAYCGFGIQCHFCKSCCEWILGKKRVDIKNLSNVNENKFIKL